MRKEKSYLPPASGGRVSFDAEAPKHVNAPDERSPPEDFTFMGRQIIIALVAAVLVGGIAGVVFRGGDAAPAPAVVRSAGAAR